MLGQEQDNGRTSAVGAGGGGGANRKSYLRSVSWTDRSPRTPSPRPKPNNKSRLCLPPLQPLAVSRRSFEEWPKAGSDDLGVWPQAPTPGAKGSIKQTQNLDSEQPEREFECSKDKLAFFDKECSRITDHIYLGSDAVAKNREVLRENGITHVLNCVGFVCPEYFKDELVYKTLWLHDSPSEDITSILYDVFDYFEDVREQSGRVLVHCCQGVSRSTSLVIAYLMWSKKQTFEDAFQYVKAARGVTNPNMGFACQLLLCQDRTLAFLASPGSVLRMYRMAPHSAYDPLHLVPKMLSQTGAEGLDSRGAFVIHVPSAVYVWIGKYCVSVMSDSAKEAAFQVIRYEMAQGPVVTIKEGKEPPEFWASIENKELLANGSGENGSPFDGERKVDLYDMDFKMFHKALSGGVVPPFPLSGTRSETRLPARENGWGILRKKLAGGNLKELIKLSKLSCDATLSIHESDYPDSPLPSGYKSCSPDVFFCSPTRSPNRTEVSCKEVDLSDPLSSPTPSCSYSFSSFLESSPKFSSKSPTLSPSTSDFSGSFTFSPSSSNWSDLSYLSSQSSPSGLESPSPYRAKDVFLAENVCLLRKRTTHLLEKAFSSNHVMGESDTCFPCKGNTLSIAERRGSNPPPRMMLPSVDETSQVPYRLTRSYSFSLPGSEDSVMRDAECNQSEQEGFYDAEMVDARNELQSDIESRRENDMFDLPSSDTTSRVTEAEITNLVVLKWPTLDKVEMRPFDILDSTSAYIIVVSDGTSGTNNANVLYIWLGRQFSCGEGKNHLTPSDEGSENSHIQWDTVGRNFLKQKGLPLNSSMQIVREGEEPEQLLNHLNCFSFHKAG